ncbi:MAG: hypothetical protein LPK14_04245 [Hymenobacteraceae bacterium]|nr:hypothetical protein [Hymenobacteraceae bacterium]
MRKPSSPFLTAALVLATGLLGIASAGATPFAPETPALVAQDTTKAGKRSSNVFISTGGKSKGNHVYINSDDNRREELKYNGDITLTDDFKNVKSISPKGYLRYVLTVNDDTKRLELESDASGNISRKYYENGKEIAYQPVGEQWLQQVMPDLIAKTGIGLEERVRAIYQKQGAKGVLAEAEKIEGEYGKQRMVNYLLQQPNLKPADANLALQHADKYLNSDYERSKMLRSVTHKQLEHTDLVTTYLQVSGKISSDYELRKVLTHLLQTPSLSQSALDKTAQATKSISSDYEKSKVLQQLTGNNNFMKGNYKAAFALLEDISSDYEKSKSIRRILSQHQLSARQQQELLPVVSQIGSDYEKSKALRSMAPQIPADATALREDYQKAARTISSDHEYRKAMEALR